MDDSPDSSRPLAVENLLVSAPVYFHPLLPVYSVSFLPVYSTTQSVCPTNLRRFVENGPKKG